MSPTSYPVWYWGQAIRLISAPTNPYNSDASAEDTVSQMRHLALQGSRSPVVRSTLQSILSKASPTCHQDIVRAIYWWVKSNVRFVEDEVIAEQYLGYSREQLTSLHGSIDLLIAPEALLGMPEPEGDCDDFTMLIGSLLIAAGYKVWFVAIAGYKVTPSDPYKLGHIYVKTLTDEGLISLDASHGNRPGMEFKDGITRRVEWEVN